MKFWQSYAKNLRYQLIFILFLSFWPQIEENRGLRLKEPLRQAFVANTDDNHDVDYVINNNTVYSSSQETPLVSNTGIIVENFFDENSYVNGGSLKPNEDPYSRNKFNQFVSDRIKSNRPIPDTRMPQ